MTIAHLIESSEYELSRRDKEIAELKGLIKEVREVLARRTR